MSLLTKHSLSLLALSLVLIRNFMSAQTAGTLDATFGNGERVLGTSSTTVVKLTNRQQQRERLPMMRCPREDGHYTFDCAV